MIKINAVDLVHYTQDQIDALANVDYSVIFNDGVEKLTYVEEITLSWHFWEIHRRFSKLSVTSNHFLNTRNISSVTHAKVMSEIRKDCIKAYEGQDIISELNRVIYIATNNYHNFVAGELNAYITGVSILDFVEILDIPEVKAINDSVQNDKNVTPYQINEAHKEIHKVMLKAPLPNNAIIQYMSHGLFKANQALQCLGPRGYVNDGDFHGFKLPVRYGFAHGITNIAEYAIESRTATIDAFLKVKPMKDAESLNRILQLSASSVKHLHRGDCGSTEYAFYTISGQDVLNDMHGMTIYDDELKQFRPINKHTDGALKGKTVKLRTIWNCKHPDRNGVCSTCFGELANNINTTDNLGHMCTIELLAKISQLILSHKHHTDSAVYSAFNVNDQIAKWFVLDTADEARVKLKPNFKDRNLKIGLRSKEAIALLNLTQVDDIKGLSPERFAQLTTVLMSLDGLDTPLTLSNDQNPCLLTDAMLNYIFNNTELVTFDESNNFIIDMAEWDYNDAVFAQPQRQFSSSDYADSVKKFLTSPAKYKYAATKFEDPIVALTYFHDLIRQKFKISLSYLQVVLYSLWVVNPEAGDFRLANPGDRLTGAFAVHRQLLLASSPGLSMAFSYHKVVLESPLSYVSTNRSNHMFDSFLMPK